ELVHGGGVDLLLAAEEGADLRDEPAARLCKSLGEPPGELGAPFFGRRRRFLGFFLVGLRRRRLLDRGRDLRARLGGPPRRRAAGLSAAGAPDRDADDDDEDGDHQREDDDTRIHGPARYGGRTGASIDDGERWAPLGDDQVRISRERRSSLAAAAARASAVAMT